MSKIDQYDKLKRRIKFFDADIKQATKESANYECIYNGIDSGRHLILISISNNNERVQGSEIGTYLMRAIHSKMKILLEEAADIALIDLERAEEFALIEAEEFIEKFNKNKDENTN